MYLSKRTYIGAKYEHNKITGEIDLKKDNNAIPIKLKRVSSIEEELMYWRKSNHIHAWFVKNVQKGEDDCGEYYIERKDLEQLLSDCQKALESKSPNILPPKSGFFFGGTEIDEWYWKDIEETANNLIEILAEIEKEEKEGFYADIYYSSSW